MWIGAHVFLLFCAKRFFVSSTEHGDELSNQETVLYSNFNMVQIEIKMTDPGTGEKKSIPLSIDKSTLQYYNITKEQLEKGVLREYPNGTSEIYVTEHLRLPIQMEVDSVIRFKNSKGVQVFSVSKMGFMARTLDDMQGDASLVPLATPELDWVSPPKFCDMDGVELRVTFSTVEILLNDSRVVSKSVFRNSLNVVWGGQGLILIAINPLNCKVTFSDLFHTADFGYYRDLLWALETISKGRILLAVTLRDASLNLGKAREQISSLGSFWSNYYQFRDGWVNCFVLGGKTLSETLIPNVRKVNETSSYFKTIIVIPGLLEEFSTCYSSWPSTPVWNARRIFCETHDGFGSLCNCTNPFTLRTEGEEERENSSELIPLVITTQNRTRHLYRLIESVGNQKGVSNESFLISVDGVREDVHRLTYILGIRLIIHSPTVLISQKSRISSNLRFALYNARRIFVAAKYFIVLEEDLVVAPDFYAYMKHHSPIFELDKSIFCVSAFNHLSYSHTSVDPSKVYRVTTYPAYGWMVSKSILDYILPKFLPEQIEQDWDFFLGSNLISNGRETLIPDINRSKHWSTGGVHVQGSLMAEQMYLSRELRNCTDTQFRPLNMLTKISYEKEMKKLLTNAIYLELDKNFQFSKPIKEGNTYVLFVRKNNDSDDLAFRFLGDSLGIWSTDARDHHKHTWRLHFRNATLLIVGVPLSPYKKYLPKDGKFVAPTNETYSEIDENYKSKYAEIIVATHENNFNMPPTGGAKLEENSERATTTTNQSIISGKPIANLRLRAQKLKKTNLINNNKFQTTFALHTDIVGNSSASSPNSYENATLFKSTLSTVDKNENKLTTSAL